MRIQIYIDPELHPALHSTLEREKNAKRRAALVKTFAERHLTGMQKIPSGSGNFRDDVTYTHPINKSHSVEPLLNDTPSISNDNGPALLIATPHVSNIFKSDEVNQAPLAETRPEPGREPEQTTGDAKMLLSAKMPISNNSTGADALASVLSDQMLGLRR